MTPRRSVGLILRVGAAALVIGLAVRSLVANWADFSNQRIAWQFSGVWLSLSFALVLTSFATLIEGWRRTMASGGDRLSFPTAARIWLLASFGRYIPGKVWALAGTAALAREAGARPEAAVSAAVLMQLHAVATAPLVSFLAHPAALPLAGLPGPALWVLVLAPIGFAAATSSRRIVGALPRSISLSLRSVLPVPLRVQGIAFAANVVAWLGYGSALVCLGRGLSPDASVPWDLAVTAFALAHVVGFVTLFAPGGIGARESVLLLLLTGPLGPRVALGLAIASRLQMTAAEIVAILPLLRRPRARSTAAGPPGRPDQGERGDQQGP